MAKPSNLFRWATNALTTLAPSSGRQDTGWANSDKPPAKVLNWLQHGAYTWFQYLDNLHGETDFLNKVYAWTAAHTFATTVGVTGAVTVGGALTVAGATGLNGGITLDGQAIVGNNNHLRLSGASNEVTYDTARSRAIAVALDPQGVYSLSGWVRDANGGLKTDQASNIYEVDLPIPQGATLTAVYVRVKPNGSWATNFQINLKRVTWDLLGAGPSVSAAITGSGALTTATAAAGVSQILAVGVISEVVAVGQTMRVRVTSPDSTPTGSLIEGIAIVYSEARASGNF